jgi:hypothetical protein
MTNASHTPGPWLYVPEADCDGDPRIDPLARPITDHTVHIGHLAIFMGTSDEAEANARLISAAPEMLEALKAAAEALFCTDNRFEIGGKTALQIVEAAITKATGGE